MSLPITAIAVVGCGPQVVLEDGTGHSTEGDSETEGGPSPTTITVGDTDPSPVTTSPPPQCTSPEDCAPGFTCQNNVCVPDDDYCYGDYGGYYGGDCCYEDCCYGGDCYNYECYSDNECGTAELCTNNYGYGGYGGCEPVPLVEECPQLPELVGLPVPEWGAGVVSLSFVEVDGDGLQDLVIGRAMATELVRGPGDGMPSALPIAAAPTSRAVSGDFNSDMIQDIATISADGTLSIATGDGMGGFVAASETPGLSAISGLSALQWDADGNLDLAGYTESGQAIVIIGDGMGGTQASAALATDDIAISMVATELDGDGRGDLVVQDWFAAQVFMAATGDVLVDAVLEGELHGERRLATADFDGSGLSEIVGRTALPDWLLLETWRDNGIFDRAAVLFASGDPSLASSGDLDGDGVPDLVIVDGSELVVLLGSGSGSGPIFACQGRLPLGYFPAAMVAGDVSGDGRVEIAARDGDDVLHLLSAL